MFVALLDDTSDVIVGKKIIDGFSFSAVCDKVIVLEYLELVRYGRLSHAEKLCNGTDAQFTLKKSVEYSHSRRVPENFEKVCQVAEMFLVRNVTAYLIHKSRMVMLFSFGHQMNLHSYVLIFV